MARSSKRFLKLGILVALVFIIVIAMWVAYNLAPKGYNGGTGPGPTAYNYVLALIKGDYDRAYASLSTDLANYPESVETFVQDLKRIDGFPAPNRPCVYIEDVQTEVDLTEVDLLIQHYDPCWKLDINKYSICRTAW